MELSFFFFGRVISMDLLEFFYIQQSIWPEIFAEDADFFILCTYGLVIKIRLPLMWGFMSGFSILFYCLLWCQYHDVFITMVFLSFLKLGMNGKIFSSSFIFQDCFNYCRTFVFPYKVDNCPFKFCKEWCWDFDGDFIGSVDYLC